MRPPRAPGCSADLGRCRDLGAAEAFDYRDERLPAELAWAGPGELIVDTSDRNDLEAAVRLLARRGRVVLLAGARSRPVLPAGELYTHDRSVLGFAISTATAAEPAEAAAALNPRFAAGGLRPRRVEHHTLADAAEAHRRPEHGEVPGRVVLLISPSSVHGGHNGFSGRTDGPRDHIRATA
ncbi:zinc-binding dehydrogenase [Amycolatopsis sp. NPDC049253]|uniref:zinc-binding dehydrogenase n=1 Tax=Amycolatopsis sp. NPDC049253 TaxID=3155274 RepID=UPI003412441B